MRLVRGGRLTALVKLDVGVRGIVAGRHQKIGGPDHVPTVLKGSGGCNRSAPTCLVDKGRVCVAHALQGLVELDQDSTILSIDGSVTM